MTREVGYVEGYRIYGTEKVRTAKEENRPERARRERGGKSETTKDCLRNCSNPEAVDRGSQEFLGPIGFTRHYHSASIPHMFTSLSTHLGCDRIHPGPMYVQEALRRRRLSSVPKNEVAERISKVSVENPKFPNSCPSLLTQCRIIH